MTKSTADPLNFPTDEIHSRLEFINTQTPLIIKECRELQKRLSYRESITDEKEKELLDEADIAFEKYLINLIDSKFTLDSFFCEAAGTLLGKGDFSWTLDAIDGSINFLRTLPLYAISMGISYRKTPVAGIIILPELSDTYSAVLGEGAFKNGTKIFVSGVSTIDRALLISSFPSYRSSNMRDTFSEISAFVSKGRSIRRTGSVVVDICWLSEGKIDGLWERDLSEFDLAAASLVLKEAGGMKTDLNGGEINSFPSDVVLSNGKIHSQIVEIIRKTRKEHTLN